MKCRHARGEVGIEIEIPAQLAIGIIGRLESKHAAGRPDEPGKREGVRAYVRADIEH
jgi:hypothetical protein